VRTVYIAIFFCFCCFFLPLQVYIIGGNVGFGIETAFFRYQVTSQGNSLILLTTDVSYVTGGIYSGRTAMSVGFWVAGTILMMSATVISLSTAWEMTRKQLRFVKFIIAGSLFLFIASCFSQYGFLLNGAAGISIPIGIIFLIMSVYLMHTNEQLFDFAGNCIR
jgi:hypothetical protein